MLGRSVTAAIAQATKALPPERGLCRHCRKAVLVWERTARCPRCGREANAAEDQPDIQD
jgi:predicted amidophosphoribosyltransferase